MLLAGLSVAIAGHHHLDPSLLYASTSYDTQGISDLQGVFLRALFLAAAGLTLLALMLVTSQTRHWWTDIGKNSLTVYLLHAVLIFPLRDSDGMDSIDGPLGTLLVILSGIALTLLLSREWVSHATRWLINPPVGAWFVAKPAREHPTSHASDSAQQSAPAASSGDGR